jgi:hypothetical protein
MAKTLQFKRYTSSELASMVGAVGELIVDLDKDIVTVHDGSTAGGIPLAKESHNHTFAAITSKPTTVSGYGIVDAYTKSEVDTLKSQYLLTSGGTLTGAITSFRETKAATTGEINLATGNLFTITVGANTSFSVSNTPTAGQAYSFVLEVTNGGAYTVSYWTGVKWASGTAPTLTAAGTDVLGFYTHDGGASWVGLTLAKDVK